MLSHLLTLANPVSKSTHPSSHLLSPADCPTLLSSVDLFLLLTSLGPSFPRPLPVSWEISRASPLNIFRAKTDKGIFWLAHTHTHTTNAQHRATLLYLHRAEVFAGGSTLVAIRERRFYEFVLISPAVPPCSAWIVCEMRRRYLYSCCFVGCYFQGLFEQHIALLCSSHLTRSLFFMSVHVVHPYSSMNTISAWMKYRFILSDWFSHQILFVLVNKLL